MRQELPHIIPSPQPEVEATFSGYQTTHEFYYEVQQRLEFQRYCQWYDAEAKYHRQELKKMRGELNIFRWFLRRF
ncbi:hypothetical protein NIES2109_44330 [Nostoc sp. HK-01]|uniref:Uncharacterized protein n=1 Tax=Anabaenopsis circularis NIES-21 TaxID=1085406 RepID=A0A1Z4GQY8_9CYAN|nr:hypothetical protein NIES21_56210 [Anabaenopsis circularis NIES-21]BBD61600.1 hypothetical protein NIES2109_44330 [Nostoc sp. HK-01]